MHALQAVQQRHHHAEQVRLPERTPCRLASREHFRQRRAVLVVHHHVRRAVGPEEIPTGDDSLMVLELH